MQLWSQKYLNTLDYTLNTFIVLLFKKRYITISSQASFLHLDYYSKVWGSVNCFSVFERRLLCSPWLHLFNQKF